MQALAVLLGAFERQWDSVRYEPDDEDHSVDIVWTSSAGRTVEQVKSSDTGFEPGIVRTALHDLVAGTPDAQKYRMTLIGPVTSRVMDIVLLTQGRQSPGSGVYAETMRQLSPEVVARLDAIEMDTPLPINPGAVQECAAGLLEDFLERARQPIPKRKWRLRIVESLVGRVFNRSAAGTDHVRGDLLRDLVDWVKGIRDEQMLWPVDPDLLTDDEWHVLSYALTDPEPGHVQAPIYVMDAEQGTIYGIGGTGSRNVASGDPRVAARLRDAVNGLARKGCIDFQKPGYAEVSAKGYSLFDAYAGERALPAKWFWDGHLLS